MFVAPVAESKQSIVCVNFQFPALNRQLRMKINSRTSTLKSLRPLLAERFGVDFSHIRLRFMVKGDKKQPLDSQALVCELPYFHKFLQAYKIEVDLQYEGG